ncbi:hypothetical protein D1814_16895 [Alteromonas sp. BL110]|nr:hypothetical protein D1814_16895 [Alteromonas sp. BL110]RKM79462.1 hypothetical protein D7031_10890 [Alteromonas sp. BL110]
MSLVRENLLSRLNYTPYCGGECCKVMPRTSFNGSQFQCSSCGWVSRFEPEFIETYISRQEQLRKEQE